MSEPFLAEIKMVGFNFAPRGWAQCDGQILPINQNQSLYSIVGTIYGGDGRTTFALPELRGRTPIHKGNGHSLGEKAGNQTVTIDNATMASHDHAINVAIAADQSTVANNFFAANNANLSIFNTGGTPNANMAGAMVGFAGGGQSHNNLQPFQALNFCIALQGLFPSRN